MTQKVVSGTGGSRDSGKDPAGLQIPNLVITLTENTSKEFYDWLQSFVIDGKNGEGAEKEGTLELFAADMHEVLFTLKLHNLGIFRLTADKFDTHSQNVRRVKAEMYCEAIEFSYGAGAAV